MYNRDTNSCLQISADRFAYELRHSHKHHGRARSLSKTRHHKAPQTLQLRVNAQDSAATELIVQEIMDQLGDQEQQGDTQPSTRQTSTAPENPEPDTTA